MTRKDTESFFGLLLLIQCRIPCAETLKSRLFWVYDKRCHPLAFAYAVRAKEEVRLLSLFPSNLPSCHARGVGPLCDNSTTSYQLGWSHDAEHNLLCLTPGPRW